MTILLIVAAVVGFFLVFSIIKKILKFIFISIALLITLAIVGYLFLTGDGSMTAPYLPEAQQEQINNVRNSANTTIQNKAQEATDAVKNSAVEMKNAAVESIEKTVEEGIEKGKEQLLHSNSSQKPQTKNSNDSYTCLRIY
jgi:hypothetical protein